MIEDQIQRGRIKIEGSPRRLDGESPYLSSLGYELTLDSSIGMGSVYTWVPPGDTVVAAANETVTLSESIAGRVENLDRTLYRGFSVQAYVLPVGESIPLLVITNHDRVDLALTPDMRIALLTFETVIGNYERETA